MRKSKYSHLSEHPLIPEQDGALIGMLLGDSGITYTESTKYHLVTEHAEKQKDYLLFKQKMFPNLFPAPAFRIDHRPRVNSVTWRTQSINHPELEALHSLFYGAGEKRVTKEIMKRLTPLGLSLWYFDDGHFDKRFLQYRISTSSFSLEEQKVMREMLRKRFGILTSILGYLDKKRNVRRYHLYITKGSQQTFEAIVGAFVIPCLEYKFGHVEVNPQRLNVDHFIKELHNKVMIQSVHTGDSMKVAEMTTSLRKQ